MATVRPSPSREALGGLIQQYFVQLTRGCGQDVCSNPDCATGSGKPLDPNAAAARAVRLAQHKTDHLCEADSKTKDVPFRNSFSSKPKRVTEPMDTTDSVEPSSSAESDASSTLILVTSGMNTTGLSPHYDHGDMEVSPSPSAAAHSKVSPVISSEVVSPSPAVSSEVISPSPVVSSEVVSPPPAVSSEVVSPPPSTVRSEDEAIPTPQSISEIVIPNLSEAKVGDLMDVVEKAGTRDYKDLTSLIWLVFSSPDALNRSLVLPEDSQPDICTQTSITVDVKAVQRTYSSLFALDVDSIKNAMVNAMDVYCSQLRRNKAFTAQEPLNHLVFLLENPLLHSPEFIKAFPKLLQTIASLPVERKESLIRWYSHYSAEELHNFVSSLLQLITLQLLFSDDDDHQKMYIPQADPAITSATQVLMLFFFANLLKAEREGNMRSLGPHLSSVAVKPKPAFLQVEDSEYEQLLCRMKVHPANAITSPVALSDFLNEELNERINMSIDYHREYLSSTNGEKAFSFLEHPFILNPANKVEKLFRDNLVSQYSERQRTLFHSVLTGIPDFPFLLLRIDRHNLVAEALVQLEAISEMNPIDLRKQLRVEFKGEEGIDEGGLQKEFFQLLVEQLFDPMNGMFLYDEDTRQHWFNPMSFESEEQYRLIGLLLGLAIYNNVILDIRFPMVVYCKLIGCETVFKDLYSSHPQIARSLQSMLDYSGDPAEFEDTFMATFQVSFADMFGTVHTHDLCENGDTIPITVENCKEYVDLYTDWLLNKSIERSFGAFHRGFDLVMGQNCLADLFSAEDVELLVCGSNEWDIDALEDSTRYDGFTPEHPVIKNFWEIVREFSEDQKKQLLSFITGSDRIPLGGLAKLKFVIVKNGPDSDRLPTAHTCFNALLMCEYSSKEKLKERLTKAISYAKGFGMM